MVEQYGVKPSFCLGRGAILAITAIVVAFSFSVNFAFAAQMKLKDEQVEKVKTALDIVQTSSNIGNVLLDGGGLMKILNTAIRGGQTATDVTYGLLVLTAINEMEFMDMVLSQSYKDEAREYFNNILDERTKLTSYWKGVGFDIPQVVTGKITSPIAALTLNTFEMTDKVISILTAFKVLEKEKRYDGLWYYFDFRRNGDSHEDAWNFAQWQMQWAASPELEQQFASLYEKWGPYATPYGISKEYKEQLATELSSTLALAAEEWLEARPLTIEKRSVWDRLVAQLASIKNAITNIVSQVRNPFSAGPIAELPAEIPADNGSPQEASSELELISEPQVVEPPEIMDVGLPLNEPASVTSEPEITEPEAKDEPISESEKPVVTESPKETADDMRGVGLPSNETGSDRVSLCQRGDAGAAKQYRVLINEVAWMGSQESSNDEWIELKNVWGIPVNLSGWQIQDKDQQIKIIFGENDTISAGGYLLLERSKDYTGALNNENEAVYLFDNSCQLEDEVSANPNWPGGDNTSKKPMQRFNVLYWYTGVGTAGAENSSPPTSLTRPNAPAPAPKPAVSKPSYSRIIISETYTGSPGNQKNDFVELYNPNNLEVTLADWYIQRKTENGQDFSSYAPSTLFASKTIQAGGYLLIANASSTFATTADAVTSYALTEENTLALKNPNGEVADEVSTGNPPSSKSFGRKWATTTESYGDFENQNPTPREKNQSLLGEDEGGQSGEYTGVAPLSVVFNEIAWAGTEANSSDEWIELYNTTEQDIDLTGWKIKKDYDDWIEFSTGTIPADGYFLLERTDDTTVSDISADKIYTGALGNGGESLELYDGQGNLIDSADFADGWPAGDNETKQTMERVDSLSESEPDNWASNNMISRNGLDTEGNQINGTPKAQNSVSRKFTEIPTDLLVFNSDFTLSKFGSPYIMNGSIKVLEGAKLTIEPGVVIKFKENYSQHSLLTIEGGLEAADVTFTSAKEQPAPGDWDGIYFKESTESKLENAIIEYAGKIHQSCCYEYVPFTNGSVKIEGGDVSIINSAIQNGQSDLLTIIDSSPQVSGVTFLGNNSDASAVVIRGENSSPEMTDSIFTGHKYGIMIQWGGSPKITGNNFENNETPIMVSGGYPSFSGNSAQNNTNGDGVFFNGLISKDANWQADLPYFIAANELIIAKGAALTIEPGVIIRFRGGTRIVVNGTLLAQGEEDNKIVFSSASDETYGSYYIYFSPTSKNSVLDNVIIRYGGRYSSSNDFGNGAVTVEESTISMINSAVENNLYIGVQLINSDSEIKDTVLKNNNAGFGYWGGRSQGLSLQDSNPDLTGSRFENNYYGIYATGDCPDLSGASFGTEDKANTYDIYPAACAP